jgi:hypothetical protein
MEQEALSPAHSSASSSPHVSRRSSTSKVAEVALESAATIGQANQALPEEPGPDLVDTFGELVLCWRVQ